MVIRRAFSPRKVTAFLIIAGFLSYVLGIGRVFFRQDSQFKMSSSLQEHEEDIFRANLDFSKGDNITGFPEYVVPNIIHIVHFGKQELTFTELLLIKSAHINHGPDKILIHCNCTTMSGEYWDMVKDIPGLEIVYKEQPIYIFGKEISWIEHASDVARLQILLEYGGIYMDSDVYVVKSLDKFRKFEFAIGWDINQYIGNQVLVAHKNARFLKLYYECFKEYRPDLWYYTAGELPTKSVLYKQPDLVHRVVNDFGVDMLVDMLYVQKTEKWRDFVTIHLLYNHRYYLLPEEDIDFNVNNIKTYNRTFGDMARLVLFGSTDININ